MNTPTADQLVNDVYSQLRHDLVKVTVCATTVRVHRHDQPDVWLQKNATEPDSLWKVYISGQYLLGMETLHDGFRFAEYCQSASNAAQQPGITDNDQASQDDVDPSVDGKCCEALNCGLILTEPFAVVREYTNKDGGPSVFAEGHYNPHGEFIVDTFDGFGDGRFDLAENSDKCANCDNAL
ncbi:MAG: hypothetical protein G8D90_21025 [gamma proteobacterium symbiont of Clathrolucina costata]